MSHINKYSDFVNESDVSAPNVYPQLDDQNISLDEVVEILQDLIDDYDVVIWDAGTILRSYKYPFQNIDFKTVYRTGYGSEEKYQIKFDVILPHVDFSEYASVLSVASHAVERFKGRGWYLTNTETEQYVVNSEMNFRYIQFIMTRKEKAKEATNVSIKRMKRKENPMG